jgi:tetratricopeptide (TPR) repeat protein
MEADMAMVPLVFPKPDSGPGFESLCLKVFRTHLKLPHLAKFGRSGQSQFGIDLLSSTDGYIVGIQCKSKTTSKGLSTENIDQIIEDAKAFTPNLDLLVIATSADRDTSLQRHVANINLTHKTAGLFEVQIYTWADFEDIFNEKRDLYIEFYFPNSGAALSGVVHSTPVAYQPLSGAAHAEIDEAARHITEGRPDVGLTLLRKLQTERWDSLAPREKFRLLANIGSAYLAKQDKQSAARSFLEAAVHQPSDDDAAMSIAAHGNLLSGDIAQAYKLSSEASLKNPLNERAQIVRLQSAPEEVSYQELEETIPQILLSNLNVALSLYERAMTERQPAEAERILRQVQEDSPRLNFALGSALLQQGLPQGVAEGMRLLPGNLELVRKAREHLTKAISPPDSPANVVANAYFNRALASLLMGDEDQALIDFRSAYDKAPENEDFGAAFVVEASRRGETVSALNTARQLLKGHPSPRSRLLLAMALDNSGEERARVEAIALLKDGLTELGNLEPELRIEHISKLMHFLRVSDELTLEVVDDLAGNLTDPLEKSIIRASGLYRLNLRNEAESEARLAADLLNDTTSLPLKREVAILLNRLNMAKEALSIWLTICSPSGFIGDTESLLRSASIAGKEEVILDYCEQLRNNAIYAPEVAMIDVEMLFKYNELRKARAVMTQYMDANPDNLPLQLSLLNIAVVQRWRGIVDAYLNHTPTSKDVKTASDGARLVQILHFKGSANAAAIVAYDLVRRFPDDPNSHRALIFLMLFGSNNDLVLDAPSQVVPGSAVCIQRSGEEPEWIVIEDSEKPEISRNEYAPDHPLSQALIGKAAGETVTLPVSLVRTKTATVKEIKHKVLFRMHQSMEQMERRFPEQSFFERVSINLDDKGHELDEVIDLTREISRGRREVEKLYSEKRMPLASLAQSAGKEIPLVVEYLARDPQRTIYCVDGTAEEFERAGRAIRSARSMVLDLTALSTIGLLNSDLDLSRVPVKCIVSEGTVEKLRVLGRSVLEDPRVQGYMSTHEDRVIMEEISPELEKERAARSTEFALKIESTCEVVGGSVLARLEPETREAFRRVFGPETAESMMIAKERECPLWTDDYVTGFVTERELSTQRVWTQSVIFWLRDMGILSDEECEVIAARLCGFNYVFTSTSQNTIIVACGLCEWNPDRQPLQGVLDRFEDQARRHDMLRAVAGLLPALWRKAPLPDYAARVMLRMLEKLARSRRGITTIVSLRQRLDVIFGLNVIGAEEARTVIEAWLGSKGGNIIEH